jgi:hypothetical protein
VPAEPPADVDPRDWARRYTELAGLPQLFIDLYAMPVRGLRVSRFPSGNLE